MLNRLLLAQSYFPELKIHGESEADDVRHMSKAVEQLYSGREIDCGSAGTVLRFMALRASRVPGCHRLRGTPRLMARPQEELLRIFRQIGVQARLGEDFLEIESEGWRMHGDTLLISSARSSQFATSVLLNAWDLPFDLYVSLGGGRVSEGYWRMSVQMAQSLGMKIDFWDSDFRVPRGQKAKVGAAGAEIDMSSAFALSAVAAVAGHVTLSEFPETSLQPDAQFVTVLERMGVGVQLTAQHLKIEKAARLNGVLVNLKSMPDLFPVLAALCALAEGESELIGAPHLVYKESNRLARMADWIRALGRQVEAREDGLKISGAKVQPGAKTLVLDCDQDHRLAFAAAVWKFAGHPVEILHREVVNKSFPQFWQILGWPL